MSRKAVGRAARAATLARESVGIVGDGAFATALASLLGSCDLSAVILTADEAVRTEINRDRKRAKVPGLTFSRRVVASTDPAELADVCRLVVLAVPAHLVEGRLADLAPVLDERHTVVHAVGALGPGDRRVSQLVRASTDVRRVAALAGPALAVDLIANRSSALVVAADDVDSLEAVKRRLHQPPVLRIYKSGDLVGVELAAALSSAIVLIAGIGDAFGLGVSLRTVLLTRAVGEMATLVGASGGDRRTAYGMAGLGNVLARSSSEATQRSRDYERGLAVGRGKATALAREPHGTRAVATGRRLADLLGVEAPIFHAAGQLLAGELDLDEATERLTAREPGYE
jgi:glycerol-3-phosphate dehydrogenase (NAD(P)+)